jgi:hypothetical protein
MIEIALGIVLAVLILSFLPYILALGFWALVAAVCIGLIAAFFYNLDVVAQILLMGAVFAIGTLAFIAMLSAIGFIAHYSIFVTKHLRLGPRPVIGNEGSLVLRYKELWFDYASAGIKVAGLVLVLVLIASIFFIALGF